MKRYLLFDSGCSLCTNLARSIERESGDKLIARSLHEPQISGLLDQEYPEWDWEPMLLEKEDAKIHVYSGTSMSLRMITILGPIRAWKVAKLVWATSRAPKVSENTQATVYSGRRNFLKQSGALLTGIALLGLKPGRLLAEASAPPPKTPVHLSEDQRDALDLVQASAEYASLQDRLVSLDPNDVWQEEEYVFIAYDLRNMHQMIEPENGVVFHSTVVFIVSNESVVHVVTLSPDTQKMRVQIADLRNPDEAPRYEPMSKQAVAQVTSVQAATSKAKAQLQDAREVSPDDLECHSVCVEPIYVPGYWTTHNVPCMVACGFWRGSVWVYALCAGTCMVATWVPGYHWCNRYEWRCGNW